MSQTFYCGIGQAANTVPAGTTRWWLAHHSANRVNRGTEAAGTATVQSAVTLTMLAVLVTANSVSTQVDITSRKNSGPGAIAMTITGGLTGTFTDTDNESLAANDTISWQCVSGGTGTFTCAGIAWRQQSHSNALRIGTGDSFSVTAASTTTFWSLGGQGSAKTVEAEAAFKFYATGTIQNMQFEVTTNGRGTSTVQGFRQNGSNVSPSATVGAGVTGVVTDATSLSVASGDKINQRTTTGTGGGTYTSNAMNFEWVPADGVSYPIQMCSNAALVQNQNLTRYNMVCGAGGVSTTESDTQLLLNGIFKFHHFQMAISANSLTSTSTNVNRISGNSGNSSIVIGAGVTGFVEDASGETTYASTDTINARNVTAAGGTSISVTMIGGWITIQRPLNTRSNRLGTFSGVARRIPL